MEIIYEKIQNKHIIPIIEVHKASFSYSFSTLMGNDFLKKMYLYPLINVNTFGFVALKNGEVVGVVLGTDDPANHRKRFFSDNFYICAKSTLISFIKKPSLIKVSLKKKNLFNDVKKSLFSRGQKDKVISVGDKNKKSTLLSICVSPESRGTNIATQLVEVFTNESKRRKCEFATLSVQTQNQRAVNFYEKLHWKPTWEGINSEGNISRGYQIKL